MSSEADDKQNAGANFKPAPLDLRWINPSYANLMLPAVEAHMYPLIGAVTVFWGHFELQVNELLGSFVRADGDQADDGWVRSNFKRRRTLLKKKVSARFPGAIAIEVADILNIAATYHWQRNTIAHGHFSVKNDPGFPMSAQGVHKGRIVNLPITSDFLSKLYHDLATLRARLVRCADPENDPHPLSSHDRAKLREFIRKYPPNLPTPRMFAGQSPPSPA